MTGPQVLAFPSGTKFDTANAGKICRDCKAFKDWDQFRVGVPRCHDCLKIYRALPQTLTRSVWRGMIARCTNPNDQRYDRYGGRGITVCDRWLNSFDAFVEDMGYQPSGCQLHRLNNDDGYNASNCEWLTKEEHQAMHVVRRPKVVKIYRVDQAA
jgi:hypothetical protein